MDACEDLKDLDFSALMLQLVTAYDEFAWAQQVAVSLLCAAGVCLPNKKVGLQPTLTVSPETSISKNNKKSTDFFKKGCKGLEVGAVIRGSG